MTRLHHSTHTMHSHHTTHRHHSGTRPHKTPQPHQVIRRGILAAFHPTTYTADVLIMEATSTSIQGLPVACHLDGTSAVVNTWCAVLFFDEQNYSDAVVLAVYPNGSQGIPVPAPGRVVFVNGVQQITNATITSGSITTFTLSGTGGIPTGALGVLYKAYFTSSSAGAYINLAPHNGPINNYAAIGNLPAANAYLNGTGLLQLDNNGQVDIKANGGNCTVNLFTHGYVM